MNTIVTPEPSIFDLIRQYVPSADPAATAGDLLAAALNLPPAEREQLFADIITRLDGEADTQGVAADAAMQATLDWADLIAAGYLEPDLLTPDGDTERLLARISGYPADALATDTVRVVLPREQAEAA